MAKTVYIDISQLEKDDDAIIKDVSSDRNDGKTTHCIRLAYETWRDYNKIAVIARRFVGEVTDQVARTMLANLQKVRPTEKARTIKGSPTRSGIHFFEDGKEFAVFIPLSRAGKVKSAFDVSTHMNLFIDEYVPLDGRYLPREVEAIMEIYRTIDRDTNTSKIWVFSNHVTATNPLMRYFKVFPKDGISRWKNGRYIRLQCVNRGNRRKTAASPLGELMDGTVYEDYMQGGTLDQAARFIHPEHYRERLPFTIRGANGLFGLYLCKDGVLVLDKADPKPAEITYTTYPTSGHDGGVDIRSRLAAEILYSLRIRFQSSQLFCASELVFEDATDLWHILSLH